jgi:hypothetical protein
MALWRRVYAEYAIDDVGGVELLAQCCATADLVEALSARIAKDGEVIYVKGIPRAHPALKEALSCRSFIVRTLHRLGLNVETIKPVGRPGSAIGVTWNRGDE